MKRSRIKRAKMIENGARLDCSVSWCNRPSRAKGLCAKHYGQVRRWGEVRPDPKKFDHCTVPGCSRGTRTQSSPYCETHYYRLRRNGTLSVVAERVPDTDCWAQGCNRKALKTNGLCRMHDLRLKRNGDFKLRTVGDNAHNWCNDEDLRYKVAHMRVKRARGYANEYQCVDCGEQAQHWSYDHNARNELTDVHESGCAVTFSSNVADYSPRCVPCHKRFDLDFKKKLGGDR